MIRLRSLVARLRADAGGASAVEFALVLPAFITLMVGTVCAAQLAFAINGLHFAVQDAARCAAVKTTVCTSSGTTIAYAQSKYSGPQISPAFAYSTTGCGHTVSATATYPVYVAAGTINVPISATSCYP
jgi:Flp pilus assembly protein TadG